MDKKLLKTAFGKFMTGVTVVTALDSNNSPIGFTANSFSSVSLDPPLISVCLGNHSAHFDEYRKVKGFSVNILAKNQEHVSTVFSTTVKDRFAEVSWKTSTANGSPLIDGCVANIECNMEQVTDAGDHILLIGRVIGLSVSDSDPLGYFRGEYFYFNPLLSGSPNSFDGKPKSREGIDMSKVVDMGGHPLISDKICSLRSQKTSQFEFRKIVGQLSSLLLYEALRDCKTEDREIDCWSGIVSGKALPLRHINFVSILRAGLGMLENVFDLVPDSTVSVIGIQRNEENAEPIFYYEKMSKNIASQKTVIVDPMLATGGSACMAVDRCKKLGAIEIDVLSIISAPEGIRKLQKNHPDVRIFTASLDDSLDENKYIIPGLGDAGDRIFGTE